MAAAALSDKDWRKLGALGDTSRRSFILRARQILSNHRYTFVASRLLWIALELQPSNALNQTGELQNIVIPFSIRSTNK
jgi:hypothetical protein